MNVNMVLQLVNDGAIVLLPSHILAKPTIVQRKSWLRYLYIHIGLNIHTHA